MVANHEFLQANGLSRAGGFQNGGALCGLTPLCLAAKLRSLQPPGRRLKQLVYAYRRFLRYAPFTEAFAVATGPTLPDDSKKALWELIACSQSAALTWTVQHCCRAIGREPDHFYLSGLP